ncbi:bifunctional nicotinamidase/pyrazinamidase [Albibacterium bauzanense]|uniref:nicotinamidase n=1 Tax=Albibacterium bauzanense TaxID=653929 RepID=A0A4R1LVZ9_9SPHI|nr:bifunctional nicotinamidase/pyrazinamidase [Albibacterium bauzanense]TCK83275.1 nicotinamidase/pyrazinamidase [Albibacterium bauzanense]
MSNILPSKLVERLRDEFHFEEKLYFEGTSNIKNNALIIIDIQYDFLPGGSLAVQDGNKIIPIINKIQEHFDLIVITQDWHPANHKSFASSHKDKKPYDIIKLHGADQVLWPVHCVQGSRGAAISKQLETQKTSLIIRKGMNTEIDSYSGFFDNERLNSTGLAGFLTEKGINKVSICGLAADFCVFYTAMDALDLGFEAEIVIDATKAIDPDEFKIKLEAFKEKGGKEISSTSFLLK